MPVKVLFVCLGNICRSPTAEAVFRDQVQRRDLEAHIQTDSAGTSAYHIGEPPDDRAQEAALRRDIDMSAQCARQVTLQDYRDFDYILAMDRENLRALERHRPADSDAQLGLFMDFANSGYDEEVPDPYYGGEHGFDLVLDMVEQAGQGLIQHLLDTNRLPANG